MSKFKADRRAIAGIKKAIEKEFNKGGGVRVGVAAGAPGESAPSSEPDENGLLYWTVWAVLEHLDTKDGRGGSLASSDDICEKVFADEDEREDLRIVERALDILESSGYIKLFPVFGHDYAGCMITSEGRTRMETGREGRGRHAVRSATAQKSLLRWLAEVERGTTDQIPLVYRHVEGSPLQEQEVDAAVTALKDKGLITIGVGMSLTDGGRQCVDSYGGNVSRYEAESRNAAPSYTNVFHGPIGSQQIAQGDYATLNQDNRQQVLEEIKGLAAQTRQIQDQLGLEPADSQALERVLGDLESEAGVEEPNQTKLKGTLDWGKDVLVKASASAAGTKLVPFLIAAFERVSQML